MGKIKGWKKIQMGNLINYKSIRGNVIVVEKPSRDNAFGLWTVTDGDGFRKASVSKTKKEAMSKAIVHIRGYPNG